MCPFLFAILFASAFAFCDANSFTFELEDRSTKCFFRTLSKGEEYYLDVQVISGGNYDVDCTVFSPDRRIVKYMNRISYETITLNETVDGDYKVCFGNVFSTITHKVVFFSWYNSMEEEQVIRRFPVIKDEVLASSTRSIGRNLMRVSTTQVRERLLNKLSYNFAMQLGSRVFYWSIGQSVLILIAGVVQVIVLRSLFSVPTTRYSSSSAAIRKGP